VSKVFEEGPGGGDPPGQNAFLKEMEKVAGENLGSGLYFFPAGSNQSAAGKREKWSELFENVSEAERLHGWESDECQLARFQYKEWQRKELAV
jgi:hypothetical protein